MRYAGIATPIISILFEFVFFQSSFAFPGNGPVICYEHVTILSPSSVKFEAGFSPAGPGTSYWFRWWLGSGPYSPRIAATNDTVIDGIQYVSAVVNSFVPDTTYTFRPTAATATDTTIGMPLDFTTNHSSLGQFRVLSSSSNSLDVFATYAPGNQRSILTIRYSETVYGIIGDILSIDTIEAGTGEDSISRHVSNLTPSSLYLLRADIQSIDSPHSISEALRSATTSYDSTARGMLAPLYISYSYSFGSGTCVLNFGVHTSGSSCIDYMLGEDGLPPWPPTGGDARIVGSCLSLGVYHDFHLYYSPAQVDTYKIRIPDIYPVHLSWPDLSSLYSGPVTLVTPDTTIDMKSANEHVIANPDISVFRIIAEGPMTHPYVPIIADRVVKQVAHSPQLESIIITNGLPTESWFEWGTTPAYGNETPHQNTVGSEMVFWLFDSLHSFGTDTTYYTRTVAKNSHGTYYGSQQSFVHSVTGVQSAPGLPNSFELQQNYPNPFNPATTLKYTLPAESRIRFTVINMLGQVVATIADDVEQAGYKSVEWNAGGVASGLYFYRLEATSIADPTKTFTQVRKMLVVK